MNAHVIALLALAPFLGSGCAATDPSTRIDTAAGHGAERIREYQKERAKLIAQQERDHSRMETAHENQVAALEAELVKDLMDSSEKLRRAQAKLLEQRRIFRANAIARVESLDADLDMVAPVELTQQAANFEEIRAQRDFLVLKIDALDDIADESWFDAKLELEHELVALEDTVH